MWPAGPASVEGSSSSLSARGSLGCSRKIFANASALRDRDGVRDDRESGVLAAMRGWRRRLGGERRCWPLLPVPNSENPRPMFASFETERHLDARPARLQLTRREVFHLSPFVQKYSQPKHVGPHAKLSSAQVGLGALPQRLVRMPVCSVPLRAGSGPKLRTGLLLLLTSHGALAAPWAPWGDTWMQHAIDLVPTIRQAHELRDSVEHGVSPTGVVNELVEAFPAPTGHSRARQRRRLSVAAPALCPTKNAAGQVIRDSSPFGDVLYTDESGAGQISLYDTQSGYASSLFCQWHVRPAVGSSQMSLIFDKFDVPVGYDSLKVYQLKCLDVECTKRNRVQMLSFPAGFDDAGRLPPLVHLQEQVGKPVHMTIRFTSRFASGSSGFIASCRPQVTAPTPISSGVTGGGRGERGEGPSMRRLWATAACVCYAWLLSAMAAVAERGKYLQTVRALHTQVHLVAV